jgi:RNA polymerase sigma-70 factor (ECF subfamily)
MIDAAVMTEIPGALASFEDVVRDREMQVLRTAYRILGNWADAEDAAQDVFVRLHRHGLRFDTAAALNAWLYRVTVNRCLDHTRAAKPMVPLFESASAGVSAEAIAIQQQQQASLMRALATLPPRERAAVVLREIEGLTTAEVAEVMGSTEGTVRSQVAKGVTRLRELLSKEGK